MLRRLKSDIQSSIKSKKLHVFFLFLISAFVILIFTKLSKEYTKTIPFTIEKTNVSQENIILNDSVALKITLKTHGFKWLTYYFSKPKITINFKNEVYKKDSVFVWKKSKAYIEHTKFGSKVNVLNMNPEFLTFRYGVNMVKKVPVKLHADMVFSAGFDISKPFVLKPDSIVVVGPEEEVAKINSVYTKYVSLKEVSRNISESIKLKLPAKHTNLKFSNTEVLLKASVEKFTEGTLKVPINIINVPEGTSLKYFPNEVNVSYYVSLSNYKMIQSKDFRVICDFTKSIKNKALLIPELAQFPNRVKNVKINQQRIEFIIIK